MDHSIDGKKWEHFYEWWRMWYSSICGHVCSYKPWFIAINNDSNNMQYLYSALSLKQLKVLRVVKWSLIFLYVERRYQSIHLLRWSYWRGGSASILFYCHMIIENLWSVFLDLLYNNIRSHFFKSPWNSEAVTSIYTHFCVENKHRNIYLEALNIPRSTWIIHGIESPRWLNSHVHLTFTVYCYVPSYSTTVQCLWLYCVVLYLTKLIMELKIEISGIILWTVKYFLTIHFFSLSLVFLYSFTSYCSQLTFKHSFVLVDINTHSGNNHYL